MSHPMSKKNWVLTFRLVSQSQRHDKQHDRKINVWSCFCTHKVGKIHQVSFTAHCANICSCLLKCLPWVLCKVKKIWQKVGIPFNTDKHIRCLLY